MSRLKIWWIILLTIFLGCIPPPPDIPPRHYDLGVARFDPVIFISVDDSFEEWQKLILAKSFSDWERASNYKISFQITWDEPKPGPYWQYRTPYEDSGLFLWHLPKNDEYIPVDLVERWDSYLGLMVYGPGENSGNVIIFADVPPHRFYSVALHEIGHLLGIKHIEGNPVVMHPNALGVCLSDEDIQRLCELYGCEVVSQCPKHWFGNEGLIEFTSASFLLIEPTYSEYTQFIAPSFFK